MLALQLLSSTTGALAARALTTRGKDLAASEEEDGVGRRSQVPLMLTKEWAMRGLTRLLRCEKGANAIEYALVATLIAVAAFAAFQNLGNRIDSMYNNVSNAL